MSIPVQGGAGTTANLIAGQGAQPSSKGGDAIVTAGDAGSTYGKGGNVLISAGSCATQASAGHISLITGIKTELPFTANEIRIDPYGSLLIGSLSGNVATLSAGLPGQAVTSAGANVQPTWAYPAGSLSPAITGFRDDFINQAGTASVTAAASVTGDTGWNINVIAGGTSTWGETAGTFTNPGIATMATPATNGDGTVLFKSSGVGALGSNTGWDSHFIVKISSTTSVCVRIGFQAGTTTSPPANGIYVEYDTGNTGNTNTDFTWVTTSASTPNYSTSNAIAADTAFHDFRIQSTTAGTILFSVDGGTQTAITTDVTASALVPFIQIIPRTGTSVTASIDFVSYAAPTTRT